MVMLYMYYFDDDVILFKSFDFKVKSVKQAYKTMNLKAFTYTHSSNITQITYEWHLTFKNIYTHFLFNVCGYLFPKIPNRYVMGHIGRWD